MDINIKPTVKQHLALQALQRIDIDTVVFGGAAGGGKSILGCLWLIMQCLQFPSSKYFIGRDTLKELRSSTIPSFYKAMKIVGLPSNAVKFNLQDNYIQFYNSSKIDLLNLGFQPADPMYERFGSYEYTSGWIEEGGEVMFDAYDTLKARVGRHLNDKYNIPSKILITCNPKKNWLYYMFYKPWINNHNIAPSSGIGGAYEFIQSFVDDNRFIEISYKKNLKSITNKIKRERLLKGNWEYESDPTALISYDSILDLFHIVKGPNSSFYITADIANIGNDKTVIMVWQGLKIIKIVRLEKFDTTMVAEVIKGLQLQFKVETQRIIVDANGLGVGVKDILRCKGFINNGRAVLVGGHTMENYASLKDQCGFLLANKISDKEISIGDDDDIGINFKEMIIQELEQLKQDNPDRDKKLRLVSKDIMKKGLAGRSPDFLDAMIMRMYFELRPGTRPTTHSIDSLKGESNLW